MKYLIYSVTGTWKEKATRSTPEMTGDIKVYLGSVRARGREEALKKGKKFNYPGMEKIVAIET